MNLITAMGHGCGCVQVLRMDKRMSCAEFVFGWDVRRLVSADLHLWGSVFCLPRST